MLRLRSLVLDQCISPAEWPAAGLERGDLILVDGLSNQYWRVYGAAPSPAFVIDTEGVIVLGQPWAELRGIRQALDRLLESQ